MANALKRFSLKSSIAFIIWIITMSVLIIFAVLEIKAIDFDIDRCVPVSIQYHEPVNDEDMEEAFSEPNSGDSVERLNSYRQELTAQKRVAICWMTGFCAYALAGAVLYCMLRETGNTKMLLYILLSVMNIVVFYNFPI
ncbi:MAG: hypothetical protein K6F49_06585 [Saccharofermentans sp.]|nr:hypothetical protein [Saccharofermentans sp.]